jgi:hypothetical protein
MNKWMNVFFSYCKSSARSWEQNILPKWEHKWGLSASFTPDDLGVIRSSSEQCQEMSQDRHGGPAVFAPSTLLALWIQSEVALLSLYLSFSCWQTSHDVDITELIVNDNLLIFHTLLNQFSPRLSLNNLRNTCTVPHWFQINSMFLCLAHPSVLMGLIRLSNESSSKMTVITLSSAPQSLI